MSLLFNTSPQETSKKRGRKPAPKAVSAPVVSAGYEAPLVATPPLGVLDDSVACIDSRCQAQCHDIVDEVRGQWFIECVFCGTGQWIPVVRGHLPEPPAGGDFVFRGGRFDGRTIAQTAREARGMDYLRWAAREHPRPAVQKACETYLASSQATG